MLAFAIFEEGWLWYGQVSNNIQVSFDQLCFFSDSLKMSLHATSHCLPGYFLLYFQTQYFQKKLLINFLGNA